MRKGQLSPIRMVILAMLVLSVVVILLLILRPNIGGFADASNQSVSDSFGGINDIISGKKTCASVDDASCTISCDGTEIGATCPSSDEVCCQS